jgi:hypothetical protein
MNKSLKISGFVSAMLLAGLSATTSAQTYSQVPVQPQSQSQPQSQPQAQPPSQVSSQPVGKVISSTPVMKRVTEPRGNTNVTEDRIIGYKVVYEYAGRQHEVQLPFPVGATIPLDVTVSSVSPAATPTIVPNNSPQPVYVSRDYPVVERLVHEPAYVEQVYYPRSYVSYPGYSYSYANPYYYSPFVPLLGITLGLGGYYRGGHYYGGYNRGHHYGGRHRR